MCVTNVLGIVTRDGSIHYDLDTLLYALIVYQKGSILNLLGYLKIQQRVQNPSDMWIIAKYS